MNAQFKEIIWNIVNSLLAGVLVLLGAISDGSITKQGIMVAVAAAGLVACNTFKDYWTSEKPEYTCTKLFKFL